MKPVLSTAFRLAVTAAAPAVAAAALLVAGVLTARADVSTWTGAGASDLWSDPANWLGGDVPSDGDSVVFGTAGGGDSILHTSLSLTRFAFAPAILPEHNFHLATGALLTLTGFGIDNNSRIPAFGQPQIPPGVIRQQFYMDAGSTMTFQNSATIGGSEPVFNLPVDLNALGGTTAGGRGGRIVFEHNSTASGPPANTFTGLRVQGGTVAGAGGGELIFRDDAHLGFTGSFAAHAGEVAGAQGGTVIFEDRAVASSGSNSNLTGAGLGGRVIFRNSARSTASINNYGAGTLEAGNEAVTQFLDDAGLDGFIWNFAGHDPGMLGGRTEFRQRATFGGTTGGASLINGGSYLGGEGGRTVFYDDTRIVGTNAVINNQTEREGSNPGSSGGVTEFLGHSRAGQATINNDGTSSSAAGTLGGRTFFRDDSSADSATLLAGGGVQEAGAAGGFIEFSGRSSAASATLTAVGGTDGGLGGQILFVGQADGAAASVTVEAGGRFDLSALTTAGTTLGAIAGGGTFFLGGKALAVGSTGASTVVTGVISDGGQAGGAGATLTKVGTGTLELAGTNTFTGPTAVQAGTLLVTGTLGDAAVAVAAGATLGGTGSIGGAVTVAGGGILAPGAAGPGTLTVGSLQLHDASLLRYDFGTVSDRIDVNGALTLDGTLDLAGSLTAGLYRLFNYSGTFTDGGLVFGVLPTGIAPGDLRLQTDVAGQVNLVLGASELVFWDGAHLTANGAVNGGTGTWANAPTNWTNSTGGVQQAWAAQKAVFSGVAGTVTLGENVSTTGLQFVTTGYVINAAAAQTLTLVGDAPVRVEAGASATINAVITGGALNKTGIGSLTLSADNTYGGGTTVTDGALVVTNVAGLGLGTGPVTVRPTLDAYLRFIGDASAGAVAITNRGSVPADTGTGYVEFLDSATAGAATISNLGNAGPEGFGAFVAFDNTAQAGSAAIENFGAAFANPLLAGLESMGAARTFFRGSSSASAATITNLAGSGNGLYGGQLAFLNASTAATANVVNRGGTSPGALGGLTLFSGSATAGTATLTAEGGANGGLGGAVRFTGLATGGGARVIFVPGGAADGLLDISGTSFTAITIGSIEGDGLIALGGKRLEVGGRNLETEFSGTIDGAGGALTKVGTAMFTLAGDSTYTGGTTVADGILRVTNPNGLGLGTGPVTVRTTPTSELRFSFSGSAGALAITNESSVANAVGLTTFRSSSTAATATITNNAATANGFIGGQTWFYATSTAANATINNWGTAFTGSTTGAEVTFFESSTAGAATIVNGGGWAANAEGGQANFLENTTAGTASLTNYFANSAGAFAGATVFRGNATAGGATILNLHSSVAGASGGVTEFFESATGGTARITLEGGFGNGALASVARFFHTSSADRAEITVEGSQLGTGAAGLLEFTGSATAGDATVRNARATVNGGGGGQTQFRGASSAGTSAFTNEGGQSSAGGNGFTEFHDTADAGAATFFNGATLAGGIFGARTRFFDAASAGTATFDNEGAQVARANPGETVEAGETNFRGTSTAAAATFVNRGKTHAQGVTGGITLFLNTSKAGTATILNEGSAFAPSPDPAGGWTRFRDGSSAEQAMITNRGATAAGGGRGETWFDGNAGGQNATADRATIVNEGGLFPISSSGGYTTFRHATTAGSATISNQPGLTAGAAGGLTEFFGNATAGAATIASLGAAVAGAGVGATVFWDTSSGGSATIIAGGSAFAGKGGVVAFYGNATAATATLRSEGAPAPGGAGGWINVTSNATAGAATLHAMAGAPNAPGGTILLRELSQVATARAIIEGAAGSFGRLDASGRFDAGVSLGSLEGAGLVFLGDKNLTIGGNHLSTEFSGSLRDEGGLGLGTGGSLTKVGTGTLELSGTNTFTGLASVQAGILRVSGSLAGAAYVGPGATLGGTGTIAGAVTVAPGGIFAPGASPGTITVGSLFLSDTSILDYEFGAVSDLAIVLGDLTLDGTLNIHVAPGYALDPFGLELFRYGGDLLDLGLELGSLPEGFDPADFALQVRDGRILLTAVPEPAISAVLLGALALGFAARRARRHSPR